MCASQRIHKSLILRAEVGIVVGTVESCTKRNTDIVSVAVRDQSLIDKTGLEIQGHRAVLRCGEGEFIEHVEPLLRHLGRNR